MINFRYHVVSLVAVFLAIALGMIMGTTVIDDQTIKALERDLRDFRANNSKLRAETDALDRRVGFYDRFGEAILPVFARGRLAGRTAVIVVQDGAPDATVDAVAEALAVGGAAKPSRIRLTAGWVLADQESRGRLAVAAGVAPGDQESVLEAVGTAIGTRLTSSADPKVESDLLSRMERAGFLRIEDGPAGTFPPAGSLLIVVPSGLRDGVPRQVPFFPALLRAVAGRRTVAVAESLDAQESLAGRVLGDAQLSAAIATIDHGDTAPGMLSLVIALRQMADGGRAGHFGVRRGTTGLMPELGARS